MDNESILKPKLLAKSVSSLEISRISNPVSSFGNSTSNFEVSEWITFSDSSKMF